MAGDSSLVEVPSTVDADALTGDKVGLDEEEHRLAISSAPPQRRGVGSILLAKTSAYNKMSEIKIAPIRSYQVGAATRYAAPLMMRHLHDFLSVNWTKWLASPIEAKLFFS